MDGMNRTNLSPDNADISVSDQLNKIRQLKLDCGSPEQTEYCYAALRDIVIVVEALYLGFSRELPSFKRENETSIGQFYYRRDVNISDLYQQIYTLSQADLVQNSELSQALYFLNFCLESYKNYTLPEDVNIWNPLRALWQSLQTCTMS